MQQQVNHVDHVCFVYKNENVATAMKKFGDALGITDWDGPKELPYFGVIHVQSLSAGIEILSPLPEGCPLPLNEYMQTHGEGFYALIYGVSNVREAAAQAKAKGIQAVTDEAGNPMLIDSLRIDNGKPAYAAWGERIKTYLEIPLQPVCGVNFLLSEIVPGD